MLALFRNYNPYVVLLLLLMALVTKLGYLSPLPLVVEDNMYVMYHLMSSIQEYVGFSGFTLSILVILSLFGQALYINNISNRYDLFNNMTYLPAFTYLLISNIIPTWNTAGPYILLNWLLLGILDNSLRLYHDQRVRFVLVNLGVLIGTASLLLPELVVMVLFGFIAISIFRAFKFGDWLAYILGLLTPLYFLFAILFYQGKLFVFRQIFDWDLSLITHVKSPARLIIAISIILLALIVGSVFLMQFMSRMVMQHQKYWTVVILMFVFTLIVSVLTLRNDWANWLVMLPAISLITNNAWLAYKRKWISTTLSYLLLICGLYYQWL